MENPVLKNLSFSGKSDSVSIGDTHYEFNVQLLNSDGDSAGIKFASVVDFAITDELASFFATGYLTFQNNLDALESSQSISTDVRGMPEQAFTPFRFRGDGRDLLLVNIKPAMGVNDDQGFNTSRSNSVGTQFELNYIFSIYETQDIVSDKDKNVKLKKLMFHEQSFQTLNERNAYFSTMKSQQKNQASSSSKRLIGNTERSIDTGSAIKELLTNTLSNDLTPPKFSSKWDTGKTKLFYSSPANNKAIDDLYYLLDYHVSESDPSCPPALLRKNRNGAWSLIPITDLFQGAYYKGNAGFGDLGGPGMSENFIIARPNSGSGGTTSPQRNPQVSIFANNLPDYSYAENFENAGMTADASTFGVVSHIVHNYDPATRTFSIDAKENNIQESMKKFNKNIVQTQKGLAGKSPSTNIVLNQTRTQNQNVVHSFNPNTDPNSRLNSGSNKIILNSIFNNNTIAFRARGSTAREAGKFITIKRNNSQNESAFDNKIMGSYLVVRVDHVFKNDQYYNYLVCTKPYVAESTKQSSTVV